MYAVDHFHFKGHTDKWCRENCDPYNNPALPEGINGSASEQRFSQLSKYAHILRYTGKDTHNFILLLLTDHRQKQLESAKPKKRKLVKRKTGVMATEDPEIPIANTDGTAEPSEDEVDGSDSAE